MNRALHESQIASVWFPALTLERWTRVISQYRSVPDDDVPVVLSRDGTHGPVVQCINTAAQRRGITVGARVVDVQAIHPDLHIEPADLDGDHALLQRLVHWARRWCPWTAQDGSDGLFLDITGAAHLFGGEARMLRDIVQRFAMQGLTAKIALAPTRGAAQALARYGLQQTICDNATLVAQLAALPVKALRVDADTNRLLTRLGLKTIGALGDVPRVALMRRFANMPLNRNPLILLDRALGTVPDPLNAPPDHVRFMARARLPEPVIDPIPHLKSLVDDLCAKLAKAEQGARQVHLTIYRIDSEYRSVSLTLAKASRDPAHILRLFDGKLDSIDPGFGFDLLTLEASRVEPVVLVQDRLDGTRDAQADVAGLLDRLSARLGQDKITWSTWTKTHKPERVEGRAPALNGAPCEALVLTPERPIRMLKPAEEVRVISRGA